jgi:mono/diheme cytochrome c family protein
MVLSKRRLWLGSTALGALVLASGIFWFWQGRTPPRTDVAAGKLIYDQHCASCHGVHLEGQPNWQRKLPSGRLPAPPHDATGHTWHHPDGELFVITKKGPSGVVPGYASDMPAFEGVLGDQQIRDVLAFIKSQWPPDIAARQKQIDEAYRSRRTTPAP